MRIRVLILFIFAALLPGCASNSVLTLMHASKHTELIVPSSEAIQQEVAGRSFQPGKIYPDASAVVKIPDGSADDFFLKLLRRQIEKGFTNADLECGRTPAYPVNIVIEEMKFTKGKIIIPDPSILRVRLELCDINGNIFMLGEFKARYLATIPFILPGVVGILPVSFSGQEWTAVAKMIPAVAVAVTKTVAGLQRGKELGAIEIYPDALAVGGVIMPDLFLRESPYGISQLTPADFNAAINDGE